MLLTDEGRRAFLTAWQQRKQQIIQHPFLGEKIPWGLVPYVQSLLLARTLRGDLDRAFAALAAGRNSFGVKGTLIVFSQLCATRKLAEISRFLRTRAYLSFDCENPKLLS